MDKTEMYNKIINAIDVMSRVGGKEVYRTVVESNYESQEREVYRIGEISVVRKGGRLCLLVDSGDITDKVEKIGVIYSKIYNTYEKQQKIKQEQKLEKVKSYLNSFVGK